MRDAGDHLSKGVLSDKEIKQRCIFDAYILRQNEIAFKSNPFKWLQIDGVSNTNIGLAFARGRCCAVPLAWSSARGCMGTVNT